jgi:LysR family transcriptional regulator, glycine cleavage system transcriptional activator
VRLFRRLAHRVELTKAGQAIAAAGLARGDGGPIGVPLLGRPDWWALWCRALGREAQRHFGINLAEEHLDAAAAIAGHGVTIGSPILFRHEIAAGRLVPAHALVAGDGRSFRLTYPAARRNSRKIQRFHRWLEEEEAVEEQAASARYIEAAVVVEPAA